MKFLVDLDGNEYRPTGLSSPFCCNNIRGAFVECVVGIASPDKSTSNNLDVNIFNCYTSPEGVFYNKFKINYYPFCGSKIEVEVE
jgi:hypothetical protein